MTVAARPFRLGLKTPTYSADDFHFSSYRTAKVEVPADFGFYSKVAIWGMLGNDEYGDCFPAGQDHGEMIFPTLAGLSTPPIAASNTLADYFAMNGKTPGSAGSGSDEGTDPRVGLNYHRKTGMVDMHGTRHKLAVWTALEPGNLTEVAESAFLTGAAGIGINCPQSAQDQFPTGYWRVVAGSPIEGGHWVVCVGRHNGYYVCITWGGVVLVTAAFLRKYMTFGAAMLSKEILNAKTGLAPAGLNLSQLSADVAAL